ncbi:CopL family metal-binding regulatory protein [Lysobacter korlensis]|uniref:CopL family metal-binding regulatory protein n=1 Tax=Lysobacter korlensis TaxID=553636 RepID=A0ABV6RR50_9GAMM
MLAFVLRLCLCLSLVIAGMAPGFASLALGAEPATPVPTLGHTDESSMPCHGETGQPEEGHSLGAKALLADLHEERRPPAHPDGGCADHACECVLPHVAHATAGLPRVPDGNVAASVRFPDPAAARDTPRLHHPLRPPIG